MVVSNWDSWHSRAASLGSTQPVTSSTWSGSSASKRSRVDGPPGIDIVLGEEVGVPGGDDAVTGEEAGGTVVGVDAVALPGVVGQDDIGAETADPPGDDTSSLPG